MHTKAIAVSILLLLVLSFATAQAQWGVSDEFDVTDEWTIDGFPTPTVAPTATPTSTPSASPTDNSGSGGAKQYQITIKVVDNNQPIHSAIVLLDETYKSTSVSGEAVFHLTAGAYPISIYSDNTLATKIFNSTITVTKTQTFTCDIKTQTVTTPNPIIPLIEENSYSFYIFIIIIGFGLLILIYMITKRKR